MVDIYYEQAKSQCNWLCLHWK